MERVCSEKRSKKFWVRLRNLLIYCWDAEPLKKIINGFGDLLVMDGMTVDSSQCVEAVVQIACESVNSIPTKLNY